VFLDETWVYVNGSGFKTWGNDTSRSVKKRRLTSSGYIVLTDGTQNGFASSMSLRFVLGKKLP
jgi:hypothetical protein